uniref:Glycosyl transferase family 2 n=1 Tax=Cyanothece sp. (strain PCC 7425 / ATCC 29141) TaxID=395961 RepID=B8HRD7_CYAP4
MNPIHFQEQPLRTVHSKNFPGILSELGISLSVSTYQASRLLLLKGGSNTLKMDSYLFDQPMGVATDGKRLAIGGSTQIWQLGIAPGTSSQLAPPGSYDACFLPRQTHVTGDIDIHEMAYADDELWFINTRLSCLCTLDPAYSFVPRWRPPFVTAYDFSDRCHLNGLGLREGQPRYVTALGASDNREGWRSNKARGGILMDIQSNQILCEGLSMPHSPRWYNSNLWVLESGNGSLAKVDLSTGTWETIVQLPGFARGLDFCGSLAFIGLSQVRGSAFFSGIPITQRCQERICGVWIVNIENGEEVAFLKFEEAIHEIFAVTVLPGIRCPEIIAWDDDQLRTAFVLPDAALKEMVFPDPDPVVDSFAVVVPVCNIETKGISACWHTLNSIQASLNYFQQHYPKAAKTKFEVLLVDDGSTDQTVTLLKDYIHDKPHFKLVQHDRPRGLAAARNTGAKACQGKAIFFCNPDDHCRPDHIFTALKHLNTPLETSVQPQDSPPPKPKGLQLPLRRPRRRLYTLPGNYPAAVKTGIFLQEPIDPHWKQSLQEGLCLNLCVRREVHEFIEGFPEQEVLQTSLNGMEESAYNGWLKELFAVVWEPNETIELNPYSDYYCDQQFAKFQSPPKTDQGHSPEQQHYLDQIKKIIEEHNSYLQAKLQVESEVERLLRLAEQAYQQGQLDQSTELYRQCLALHSRCAEAHYKLGVIYMEQNQTGAAIVEFEQVLREQLFNSEAYHQLGLIYQLQNQTETAIAYYLQSLNLRPDQAKVRLNLAQAYLQKGDLALGFVEYEWRTQMAEVSQFDCPHPRWNGEAQLDQTILIYAEQGLEDAIQFVRLIPLVRQRCQRVILVCPPELTDLFRTAVGVDEVRTPNDIPLEAFQTYVSLSSLPLLLGITLENLPQSVPYLNVPASSKLQLSLPKAEGKLRVGICWTNEPISSDNGRYSCRLSDFRPVLKTPGIDFYSLRKVVSPVEQDQLDFWQVTDLSKQLPTFAETAAAIAQLDLIITVDTVVAHLAGALGKPVWTLLCYSPDWCWMLKRTDSPWYPTMRLFRQTVPGEWTEVFMQVQQALDQLKSSEFSS